MIELSILELLYLVLIFFITIIGTLLIVILIRVMKIVGVISDLTGYYWKIQSVFATYSQVPLYLKERIFQYFSRNNTSEQKSQKNATK